MSKKDSEIFIKWAETAFNHSAGDFWFSQALQIAKKDEEKVENMMGYWGSGDGNNNPKSLDNNQRSLLLCFAAAMAETGDL